MWLTLIEVIILVQLLSPPVVSSLIIANPPLASVPLPINVNK